MVVHPDGEKSCLNQITEGKSETDWKTSTAGTGLLERGNGMCRDENDWKLFRKR